MSYAYKGVYTAIITPFGRDYKLDEEGLEQIVRFQEENGVSGVVAVGTTGESPTLSWQEHKRVFELTAEYTTRSVVIASTGSNSTAECMDGTAHARDLGIGHVLLVDPYYNGPSSLEIRREYVEPVAKMFPELNFIPYVIPGRTGTQLLPQDLAILSKRLANVKAVKEATGSLENMRLTRTLCGPDFSILSGDDDKTFDMMTDVTIRASGVISVVSNVAPRSLSEMCSRILNNDREGALKLWRALSPLCESVTVKSTEVTPFGDVVVKARNPVPIKTAMRILGIPSGPARPPLGRMTKRGVDLLLEKIRLVYRTNPEVLEPLEKFFDVKLERRLYDPSVLEGLYYDGY
jgi:4-hydroxy-tetrahydrodipicolinate synthase